MCGFDYIDNELPIADLLIEADSWEDFCTIADADTIREALNHLCSRGFQLAEIELNDWPA